jgi:hypothetical protein
MKKFIVGSGLFLFALLVVMTTSDIYYSNLEKNYSMLTDQIHIDGKIANYRVHWGHAYVTLSDNQKLHIQPAANVNSPEKSSHDLIEVGDSLRIAPGSGKLIVKKKDQEFIFVNRKTTPY